MQNRLKYLFVLASSLLASNYYALSEWLGFPFRAELFVLLTAVFCMANILLPAKHALSKRLALLESGSRLLKVFLCFLAVQIVFTVCFGLTAETGALIVQILTAVLFGGLLFWNGMLRVYLCSAQLGVKWRVIGALCGWIPLLNLWALHRIITIASGEAAVELEKLSLQAIRAESELCRTKYPLLLVHGVFFRDSRLVNYWGRIPAYLRRNGAELYYGEHGSAASVLESGKELAARIRQITEETGCGRLNLIAHSKGGLDCRAAISRSGAAHLVASLTTINTPHRGCLFADSLLEKIPEKIQVQIAKKYNNAAGLLGDRKPDFLQAVHSLTAQACAAFNRETPDSPEVYYQSVGSVMKRAKGGTFPMNLTYRLVKYFDGENDGLVSVESMKWGKRFTLIQTEGKGVSHADVIDLDRKNKDGFDVREFYLRLVQDLKSRGY